MSFLNSSSLTVIPLIAAHFDREIHREAIGIVELESVRPEKTVSPLALCSAKKVCKYLHAGVDGLCKVLFLGLYDLGDIACFSRSSGYWHSFSWMTVSITL